MHVNRRELIVLSGVSAAALGLGCQASGGGGETKTSSASPLAPAAAPTASGATVDAGPASAYAADGVYARFRDRGFFLVRRGDQLLALSSICTHRTCPVSAQADGSFQCTCHGSTFDPQGHVTKGPATKDLPVLPVVVDAQSGHVLVSNVRRP